MIGAHVQHHDSTESAIGDDSEAEMSQRASELTIGSVRASQPQGRQAFRVEKRDACRGELDDLPARL